MESRLVPCDADQIRVEDAVHDPRRQAGELSDVAHAGALLSVGEHLLHGLGGVRHPRPSLGPLSVRTRAARAARAFAIYPVRMVQNSPADSLHVLEAALRQLVDLKLSASVGQDWISRVVADTRVQRWQSRMDDEKNRARGKGQIPKQDGRLLDYSELFELRDLLHKRWDEFAPVFGNKSRTLALLDEIESYRNDIAHSRPLQPFQAQLVAGVAGLIRNKVVLALSSSDATGSHYPSFTFARDSFGQELAGAPSDEPYIIVSSSVKPLLYPGVDVGFEFEAVDPQGRDMTLAPPLGLQPAFDFAAVSFRSGERVALHWTVEDKNVAQSAYVYFQLTAHGTPYHRTSVSDQRLTFIYRVDPPLA